MTQAFDLRSAKNDLEDLSRVYADKGFHRARKIYALRWRDELAAIIELNMTDLGLNMSDLTNCIRVIIVQEALIQQKVMARILHSLAFCFFKSDTVPVLLFPARLHTLLPFRKEKNYDLWILNLEYSDQYIEYLSRYYKFER